MRIVANKITDNKAQISGLCTVTHDETELNRWKLLLKDKIGMSGTSIRPTFLFNCLNGRMNQVGIQNYQHYYEYLHAGEHGSREWQKLVDVVTVHETWFYRHPPSLKLLQEFILTKVDTAKSTNAISGWSVGCATGEEAYTLVMLLDTLMNNHNKGLFFHVLASDISQSCLEFAYNGRYTERQIKKLPEELYTHYFSAVDNQSWQIKKKVKEHVTFKSINLCDFDPAIVSGMDFIFCQNVLIYFDKQDRIKILSNLCDCLTPGGLLVLGAGEINQWSNTQMQQIKSDGVLAYRKNC